MEPKKIHPIEGKGNCPVTGGPYGRSGRKTGEGVGNKTGAVTKPHKGRSQKR